MLRDGSPHTPQRWLRLWAELGARTSIESLLRLQSALLLRYAEPHRAYHTATHLAECLELLDEVREHARRPAEVELALWFHDAIYERSGDNEGRSADWAAQAARESGLDEDVAQRVHALVCATQHRPDSPADADARLLVDVDLAILGAAPPRFAEYQDQIRREYLWVPGLVYRRKRRAVLQGFLARRRIYCTDACFVRFERQARVNLARALR